MKQLFITVWWLICSITPVVFDPSIYQLLYNQCASSFFLGAGLLLIHYLDPREHGIQIFGLIVLTTIFTYFNVLIIEELQNGGHVYYESSTMVYNIIIGLELTILIPCSVNSIWKWYKNGLSGLTL